MCPRSLNVLALSNHFPPHHGGGYGLQCQLFCEGLSRRGHAVRVVTSRPAGASPTDGGTERIPVRRSLELIPASLSGGRLLRRTLANTAAVRRALRQAAPDVVLCFGMDGVGFNSYLAAIRGGRPCLTWLGDTWLAQAWRDLRAYDAWTDLAEGGRRHGLRRTIKRAIGGVGRALGLYAGGRPVDFAPVAAISSFVLDDLREAGAPVAKSAPIIPIVLDTSFFSAQGSPLGHGGIRTRHLRALFVGRAQMLKGPDMAIAGVAAAVALGADVRLTMAGLGLDDLRPELERIAAAQRVGDRITWAGTPTHAELPRLYRDHDVFLFPSRIVEGLGIVNCEAMACGLPVIGTAHSGSADVILDGETGFRVPMDDAAAIGRHLAALQTDRGLLGRLSESAARQACRFHPDVVVAALASELERLVSTARDAQVVEQQ